MKRACGSELIPMALVPLLSTSRGWPGKALFWAITAASWGLHILAMLGY